MDQLVNIEPINISELNSECVFQSSFWAYVKSPNWVSYAFRYQTNRSEGTFLILVRKLFLSFSIAYSPFCFKDIDSKELIEISKKIKKYINENIILVRYDLSYSNDNFSFIKHLHKCKYSIQPKESVIIDLEKDLCFKQRVRRNLKKEAEVEVFKWDDSEAEYNAWYRTYLATAKRDGFDARGKAYIKRLLSYNGVDVKPILYIAKHNNEVIGGIINIRNSFEEIYLFGSSKFIKDGVSCGYSLQSYAINRAKEDKLKYYDLFGIGEGNLNKLTTFKTSFGGEAVKRPASCDYYYNKILASCYKIIENIRFKAKRG